MGRHARKKDFWYSNNRINWATYRQYLNRLTEINVSMFKWNGLPDTIDPRFIEMTLFVDGSILFFKDEAVGYLALQSANNGPFDFYRVPVNRRAYAVNGYQNNLTNKNSVLIYNNYLRTNGILDAKMYAERLANLDRAIDVNANAQKTPILIRCEDSERLTMENLYLEYQGNAPVIFGRKALNASNLDVLKTDAPFVADKLYSLKNQYWNEALESFGVEMGIDKKERLNVQETNDAHAATFATRMSKQKARENACKQINEMFPDLNVSVEYNPDFQNVAYNMMEAGEDIE